MITVYAPEEKAYLHFVGMLFTHFNGNGGK